MGFLESLTSLLLTIVPLLSILAVWIGSLFDQRFANAVYKVHLLRLGLTHLLMSTDRKWKKTHEADAILGASDDKKQVVFMRHGESKWNLVFNKGFGKDFPGRLGRALAEEARVVTTLDSVFVDSPLSEEGCTQAKELKKFVEGGSGALNGVLRGVEGESVLCASNLRRALSTATIAMWDRLQRTQEKVHILSCLQEVTFNIDGVALAKPQGFPELCHEELEAFGMSSKTFQPERYYNASENDGDKPVNSHGIDRIREFCQWCFERDEPTIIAAGHSLYFRYFFDTFLPKSSAHEARRDKMENCAVISFTLYRAKPSKSGAKYHYRIDEQSIKADYLGFEQPKKKKAKKND
jgi:hypothetical protein